MADVELFSINVFAGNGSQTNFDISFAGGYISQDHVKAYRRIGNGASVPTVIQWVGPNQIMVQPAPLLGEVLVVYRDTPKDKPLANFSDGAVLSEASLDINAQQAVFIAQEAQDNGAERIDTVERQSIKSGSGGLVGPGFVVVDTNGVASGQDFLNVIKTLSPVVDDGTWGDAFLSDGVWG